MIPDDVIYVLLVLGFFEVWRVVNLFWHQDCLEAGVGWYEMLWYILWLLFFPSTSSSNCFESSMTRVSTSTNSPFVSGLFLGMDVDLGARD